MSTDGPRGPDQHLSNLLPRVASAQHPSPIEAGDVGPIHSHQNVERLHLAHALVRERQRRFLALQPLRPHTRVHVVPARAATLYCRHSDQPVVRVQGELQADARQAIVKLDLVHSDIATFRVYGLRFRVSGLGFRV